MRRRVTSTRPTNHKGQFVFKRYNPNYSLWPERARPGRRRLPLMLAAGSFAVGFVCAAAAYTVFSAFVGPAAVQESPAQRDVQDSPLITPETPPAPKAPPPPENTNHASRTPARAARNPLPIIGSQAARPNAATDGRGGDPELAGGPSATDVAASSDSAPNEMREEGDPALQPRAEHASIDVNTPVPASEPTPPPRKKTVRKTRERTNIYAERSRQKRARSTTYAAARERPTPAYSGVSETASWY